LSNHLLLGFQRNLILRYSYTLPSQFLFMAFFPRVLTIVTFLFYLNLYVGLLRVRHLDEGDCCMTLWRVLPVGEVGGSGPYSFSIKYHFLE
jgi:hypothetical protein